MCLPTDDKGHHKKVLIMYNSIFKKVSIIYNSIFNSLEYLYHSSLASPSITIIHPKCAYNSSCVICSILRYSSTRNYGQTHERVL